MILVRSPVDSFIGEAPTNNLIHATNKAVLVKEGLDSTLLPMQSNLTRFEQV